MIGKWHKLKHIQENLLTIIFHLQWYLKVSVAPRCCWGNHSKVQPLCDRFNFPKPKEGGVRDWPYTCISRWALGCWKGLLHSNRFPPALPTDLKFSSLVSLIWRMPSMLEYKYVLKKLSIFILQHSLLTSELWCWKRTGLWLNETTITKFWCKKNWKGHCSSP